MAEGKKGGVESLSFGALSSVRKHLVAHMGVRSFESGLLVQCVWYSSSSPGLCGLVSSLSTEHHPQPILFSPKSYHYICK